MVRDAVDAGLPWLGRVPFTEGHDHEKRPMCVSGAGEDDSPGAVWWRDAHLDAAREVGPVSASVVAAMQQVSLDAIPLKPRTDVLRPGPGGRGGVREVLRPSRACEPHAKTRAALTGQG